jgi:hypothetical protein
MNLVASKELRISDQGAIQVPIIKLASEPSLQCQTDKAAKTHQPLLLLLRLRPALHDSRWLDGEEQGFQF